MSDPNSTKKNNNLSDEEAQEFVENLVTALTGQKISEIPAENQAQIVGECLSIFNDYIIKYVESKFGKKHALRLQSAQKFDSEDVFKKFGDLNEKFEEAYNSFLDLVKESVVKN
jgi:hypothetical protein